LKTELRADQYKCAISTKGGDRCPETAAVFYSLGRTIRVPVCKKHGEQLDTLGIRTMEALKQNRDKIEIFPGQEIPINIEKEAKKVITKILLAEKTPIGNRVELEEPPK